MANRGYDAVIDVDTEVRILSSRPQTAMLTKAFPKGRSGSYRPARRRSRISLLKYVLHGYLISIGAAF
jgi:hypothetical protein